MADQGSIGFFSGLSQSTPADITTSSFFRGLSQSIIPFDIAIGASAFFPGLSESTPANITAGGVPFFSELSQRVLLDVFTGGTILINKTLDYIRPLPVWAADTTTTDPTTLNRIPVNGQISGIVKLQGVPIADRIVRLYYRKNGVLIGSIKTDSTGTFQFLNLDPSDRYTVIAFDDTNTSPDFNAQIFDILTPT